MQNYAINYGWSIDIDDRCARIIWYMNEWLRDGCNFALINEMKYSKIVTNLNYYLEYCSRNKKISTENVHTINVNVFASKLVNSQCHINFRVSNIFFSEGHGCSADQHVWFMRWYVLFLCVKIYLSNFVRYKLYSDSFKQ